MYCQNAISIAGIVAIVVANIVAIVVAIVAVVVVVQCCYGLQIIDTHDAVDDIDDGLA